MEHSRRSANDEVLIHFENFFRDHYVRLVQFVARRVPPSHVDDVVSASFVVAWRKFDRVENPSLPWLFRIASYEVANQRRALRRIGATVALDACGEIPERTVGEFDGTEVVGALHRLSDDDQELLRLVHWDRLSRADVAEILNLTVNAANVRYHRALQRLQSQMPTDRSDDAGREARHIANASQLIKGVLP